MSERAQIYDVLYSEVMASTRALEKARRGTTEARETARAALERAVQRYTDFSMDGKVPDDVRIQRSSHQ